MTLKEPVNKWKCFKESEINGCENIPLLRDFADNTCWTYSGVCENTREQPVTAAWRWQTSSRTHFRIFGPRSVN